MISFLGLLALLCALAHPAVAARHAQGEQTLRIATKPLGPFVIKEGNRWAGFSISLWEEIAQGNGWECEWVEVKLKQDGVYDELYAKWFGDCE